MTPGVHNLPALRAYLATAALTPAELGKLDCVRFVIEAIRAGWGQDFRGCLRYECRHSAVVQLREDHGLRSAFCKVLGEPIPAAELVPGDIAYVRDAKTGTRAVGLVLFDTVVVKVGRTIARVPLAYCDEGWTWARP